MARMINKFGGAMGLSDRDLEFVYNYAMHGASPHVSPIPELDVSDNKLNIQFSYLDSSANAEYSPKDEFVWRLSEMFSMYASKKMELVNSLIFENLLRVKPFLAKLAGNKEVSVDTAEYFMKFDSTLDDFLRNRLWARDASDFKWLLAHDAELRDRAATVALMIKSMQSERMARDVSIADTIRDLSDDAFLRVARIKHHQKEPVEMVNEWEDFDLCISEESMTAIEIPVVAPKLRLQISDEQYLAYRPLISAERYRDYSSYFLNKLRKLFDRVRRGKHLRSTTKELRELYDRLENHDPMLPDTFLDDVAWNYGVALLKTGKNTEARDVLSAMSNRNSTRPDVVDAIQALFKIND